ncbi:hypothetical protein SprV_0501752300 [Sparganum proliferum]
MVRQLHDGIMARLMGNAAVSEAFAVTNGVKQGRVLLSTLLSPMFSLGIRIAYRTDGELPNHRRMHFQSRVSTTTVRKILFADDCVLNATTEGDMQRNMYLFAVAFDKFVLVINTEKAMAMHQSPPDAAYVASKSTFTAPTCKWWTSSVSWAAPSLATPKSTMKWPAGFLRPAKPSVVCKAQSGNPMVSNCRAN